MKLIDLLIYHEIVNSRAMARRVIVSGGVRVNGVTEREIESTVTNRDVVVFGAKRTALDVPEAP